MREVPIFCIAVRHHGPRGGESLLTVAESSTLLLASADVREAQALAKACGGRTVRVVVQVEATPASETKEAKP